MNKNLLLIAAALSCVPIAEAQNLLVRPSLTIRPVSVPVHKKVTATTKQETKKNNLLIAPITAPARTAGPPITTPQQPKVQATVQKAVVKKEVVQKVTAPANQNKKETKQAVVPTTTAAAAEADPICLCHDAYKLYEQGKYHLAAQLYKKSGDLYQKRYGSENHEDVALLRYDEALCYYQMDRNARALPLAEKSVKIYEKVGQSRTSQIADVWNLLGDVLVQEKSYGRGDKALSNALEIYGKEYGNESTEFARTLYSQGYSYSAQGRYDASVPVFKQCVDIRTKLADDKDDLKDALVALTEDLRLTKKDGEAKSYEDRLKKLDK